MSTAIIPQPVRQSASSVSFPARLLTRWHLLSLDAPTVAAVWLVFLNRNLPSHELLRETLALGIAVWMIYVMDRLLDATRSQERLQERHHFHLRHKRVFSMGLLLAAAVLAVLVPQLLAGVRDVWCLLALPLLIYAALVHWFTSRLQKEIVIGVFFAVAVTAPTWTVKASAHVVPEAIMFCLLCWWNCLSITKWEGALKPAPAFSLLSSLPYLYVGSLVLCTGVGTSLPVVIAAAISGGLLLIADAQRRRFDPLLLRSFADAALLAPVLFLPLLHGR